MKITMRSGEDGPLLLAMMLANVNNNWANAANNNNTVPADSLQLQPSSVVLEYEPQREIYTSRYCADGKKDKLFVRAIGFVEEQNQTSWVHNGEDVEADAVLSADQLQFWNRNGYLVIEEALRAKELADLHTSLMNVIEQLSFDTNSARKCHSIASDAHGSDGSCVVNPNGRLIATLVNDPSKKKLNPLQRIRRMGTGVHRVLPAFGAVTFSSVNQRIVSLLGFEDPRVTQSIVITKPQGIGAQVIPHQDGCSSFTDPPSCVTFWYALQDASKENGCLKVVPGSHRTEPLTLRARRGGNGFPDLVELAEPVYAKVRELEPNSTAVIEPHNQRKSNDEYVFKPLEVRAGTLVLMHGNLVHASDANKSNTDRLAYNFGVVEGKLPWPKDAYLQPYEGHSEFERLEARSPS